MKTRSLLSITLSLGLLATTAAAADWPQWRGPQRNGISSETGLARSWPAEGPRLIWHVKELGNGYGTPAVVGERMYVLGNAGLDNEFVQALKVSDGKPIWKAKVGPVGNPNQQPSYPGSRSTPTVDGALVYALGSDGDLVCVEAASGKERWRKSLRKDFGGQPGIWAYAESPLVDGDKVVVTPGGAEATLVALNKRSGAVVWKSAIPGGEQAAYASVIPMEVGGTKEYVQFLQKGVVGVDAATGKFLWRYDRTAGKSPANIPSAVANAGMVYTATGLGGGGVVKIKSEGGQAQVEEVYFATKLPNAIGGSVRVGDYLYGTTGAGIMCVEFATGKVKWQERGVGAGSILYADGLLFVHGENGQVLLVEATPDAYKEKGKFSPPDQPEHARGQQAWAYPALANGRLYIRDQGSLWCYDVKAK